MEWKIRIHRKALKFLKKLSEHERNLVIMTLYELLKCLEKGSIPYRHFDIRKLKGRWEGF